MLNVVYPSQVQVTQDNIIYYRLGSIKHKLNELKGQIKDEYAHMYDSIYEKLELENIDEVKVD